MGKTGQINTGISEFYLVSNKFPSFDKKFEFILPARVYSALYANKRYSLVP